jgi:hypothetical protein
VGDPPWIKTRGFNIALDWEEGAKMSLKGDLLRAERRPAAPRLQRHCKDGLRWEIFYGQKKTCGFKAALD